MTLGCTWCASSKTARLIVQSITLAEVWDNPVLRELVAGERERVRLVLTQGQVLVRTLTLPAAIEENLVKAIGFEIPIA